MTSADWAAWVQAIGSVGAIAAALTISNRQFREAAALQSDSALESRLLRYEAVFGVLESVATELSEISDAMHGKEPKAWFQTNSAEELMQEFYAVLGQISPLDMPSRKAASSLCRVRNLVSTAGWNAKTAIGRLSQDHETPERYFSCVEAFDHNLSCIRSEHEQLLAEFESARVACARRLDSIQSDRTKVIEVGRTEAADVDKDPQLERLFDYTKFHIGIYLSAAGALLALVGVADKLTQLEAIVAWPPMLGLSLICMVMAGMAGGMVASSCTECTTYAELWEGHHKPFATLAWPALRGKTWASIEHRCFWASVLLLMGSIVFSTPVFGWLSGAHLATSTLPSNPHPIAVAIPLIPKPAASPASAP